MTAQDGRKRPIPTAPAKPPMPKVEIYHADLQNGQIRMVEPHESGGRWLEIDDQHQFNLEDME